MKITSVVLLAVLRATSSCVDVTGKFYVTSKQRNRKCKWAGKKNTSKRCEISEILLNCPVTCDNCGCFDNPDAFTLIANNKSKTCAWVGRNSAKIASRCAKYPSKLNCPVTCEVCGNEPSVAPTLSKVPSNHPTLLPTTTPTTSAPTSGPSLSVSPSTKPSSSPTAAPTFICADTDERFRVDEVAQNKSCDWVANNPDTRCAYVGVSELCPFSCGSCPNVPSLSPSVSEAPSLKPSWTPSELPSLTPSSAPSLLPSSSPSMLPSLKPSTSPSDIPSTNPSGKPSNLLSQSPSIEPSQVPSTSPSDVPSTNPSDSPSLLPSSEPSSQPSVCVDDPNWIYPVPMGGTLTCSDSTFVCVDATVAAFRVNDKTSAEACCGCGGSIYVSVPPSLSPSSEPSSRPSDCLDVVGWSTTHSGVTYDCTDMTSSGVCTLVTTAGTGGYTASQACCNCSGGQHTLL